MMQDDSNLESLRIEAEKKLYDSNAQFSEILASDKHEQHSSLYEIELQKMELEIQNEALLKAQFELETIKSHYINLYEQAPVGFVTLNSKGFIVQSNHFLSQLLGIEKDGLQGCNITEFIANDDQDIYYHYRKEFINGQHNNSRCELHLLDHQGNESLVNLKTSILIDELKDNYNLLTTITCLSSENKINPETKKQEKHKALISKLSKREKQVLNLVLKGYSNKDIASRLNINYRTVEQHRSRILLKTGLNNFLQFPN